jgi:lipopolysaccharide/colanic/teichoic acid biosynthesis glycosyltransferase
MSSLSFDNLFSPDAADRSEGVSHISSTSRTTAGVPSAWSDEKVSASPKEETIVRASPWALCVLRRALDFSVAAAALVVFMPVMLFAAFLVWWGSPGPVFFRQRRMGRDGREFTLFKFRSMCPKKGSYSSITVSGDVRITPVGALLRRYKLDELPQFWNVLRGDMSLVGPRPKLPQHEALRMVCRPGITGVATLAFRKEEEFLSEIPEDQLETFYETYVKPAKAQLDLEYMRTATLASDLRILWRTASACLFSTEGTMADSAESIVHYETAARAARIRAQNHASVPGGHPMAQSRVFPAHLNQEL